MRKGLVSLSLLVLAACEGGGTLTVDVRTDFVGGVEFTAVRTDVLAGPPDGMRVGGSERAAFAEGQRWFTGERVAEVSDLTGDDYSVRVRLLGPDGATVAERVVRVQVRTSYALVVVMTRSCGGVECPGPADDPAAITCFGGRCVDPRCGADPAACPEASCAEASDCPGASVPCVRPACVEGACLLEPTGTCAADEYCDVDLGCRPRMDTSMDAAVPDVDGGVSDAGSDAGPGCVEGAPCETGDVCAVGEIRCVDDEPTCVAVAPAAGDTVCRASTGPCDPAETCGGAMTCPMDALADASTECRASTGECDAAESCTGASPDCPADGDASDGTICSAGVCIGGACVACSPGLPCVLGPCERGTIDCAGGTPRCTGSSPASAGIECRAAAGPCDVAETCNGSSTTCPTDAFRGTSTVCRTAAGPCDVDDTCSGSSAACPTDRFRGAGFACRTAAGACDVEEQCSGSGPGCPGDVLRGAGIECRAASGPCDVPETCTGSSAICPGDGARAPAGTECRASMGVCDVAEQCDGSSTTCPTDRFATAGTTCRPGGDACNPAETCSGTAATCPPDAIEPDDTACGMESCTPFGACGGTGCDLMMGTQSSTCTTPACAGGMCRGSTMRTDMQMCTRTASCPDACCNAEELGDTCSSDCGPMPIGLTGGTSVYTTTVGNPSGMAFEDVCPDDHLIEWMTFDYEGNNFFEGLSGTCRRVDIVPDRSVPGSPVYAVRRLASFFPLPSHGRGGWTTWNCPADQFLTGFRAATVQHMGRTVIDAVELRCSTLTTTGRTMPGGVSFVITPGGTELADDPFAPPAGTLMGPYDCPAGTVARGFRGAYSVGATADVLERFGLVCQAITPR